jgi:hypothetical protein
MSLEIEEVNDDIMTGDMMEYEQYIGLLDHYVDPIYSKDKAYRKEVIAELKDLVNRHGDLFVIWLTNEVRPNEPVNITDTPKGFIWEDCPHTPELMESRYSHLYLRHVTGNEYRWKLLPWAK